jgi:ATP-dependent DNA helicase RecG
MEFVRKNIQVEFVMTGKPERKQIWEYPLEALREAVVNTICHRDYIIPSNVEIRIYDNKLIIWNPGGLPFGISLNDIFKPHSSVLRNKGIGGILYDIGWIEQWGSGIDKMRESCAKAGLPEPKFEEYQGGFRITFLKDIYTEEYLRGLGLNERQIKAVMHVKERGKITNREYREMSGLSDEGVRIDINRLIEKNILQEKGKGRNTFYIIKKAGD